MLVGYRGVDGSCRLACPAFARALRGRLGSLDPRALDRLRTALADDVRRLRQHGVDLAGYTVAEVVADIEAACDALGLETVDLLSASYGTRLTQLYGHLHRERVGRSVMIGVNPPGCFVWEPDAIEAVLRRYADAYRRRDDRDPAVDDLVDVIRHGLGALPPRWRGVPIDPGKVRVMTFLLLFNVRSAAMVIDAYLAAARGDASGLALLSVAAAAVLPRIMLWGDLFAKGTSADFDASRNYAADLDRPDLALGAPLSLLIWGTAQGAWPATVVDEDMRQAQPSDVETLLIGGNLDMSTPPELATTELLPLLSRGHQVILRDAGHVNDLWHLQPAATERLLTSFYATGKPDSSLCHYVPLSVRPTLRLPVLARTAVSLGVGAVAAALGWGVIQHRRRILAA